MKRLSASNGRPSCARRCFPTLATALDGGVADARTAQFLDQLEAGVAARLAAAPEQMQIPLAHLVLIKRPKAR